MLKEDYLMKNLLKNLYWISDDGHHIEATLTKNKDIKIVSTDSNHNFD